MKLIAIPKIWLLIAGNILLTTISAGKVYAKIPEVAKNSPLKPLIEDYNPDYAGSSQDPLHTPELKAQADHAVRLGWQYFNQNDHQTALKRFLLAIRFDDRCKRGKNTIEKGDDSG